MIPIPFKVYASVAAAILFGILFAWYRHSLISEGEAKILAANSKQAAALQQQADEITADWKVRADTAEHLHDTEITDLRAYRDAHPITGASELCKQSPSGQGHLSATTAPNRGHAAGAPSATVGVDVSTGNPDVATNRIQMLDDFAAILDTADARLREWQALNDHP